MWWLWICFPSPRYPLQLCTETWNIVPVLGAIQADLMYRVYNISRSNWMFKHPWDSWNRMQFYSTSSKPTCDKPKAEGRRPENASEASSMDPKCIRLKVNSSRRARSVFIPKCLHLNWVKKTGIKDTSGSRGDHWSFKHPCWEKSRSTV